MWESLIFALILLLLNLIFIMKPVPIIGFFVGVFTMGISVLSFLNDSSLPVNSPTPYFTIFIILFGVMNILAQTIDIRRA